MPDFLLNSQGYLNHDIVYSESMNFVVREPSMLKRISIILVILSLTATAVVQAQGAPKCDPYHMEPTTFSVSPTDLTAPTTGTEARVMAEININPAVLNSLTTSITEITPTRADFANPNTHLRQAAYGLVTPQGNRLAVYAGVCTNSSQLLTQLAAGSRVTVLDGPFASEGFAWWRVRRGPITGWVQEGSGTSIWLQGLNR